VQRQGTPCKGRTIIQNRRKKKEVEAMEMKFYKCAHCGQMIAIVKETGVPVICCGEPMQEMVAGTTDAAVEKHVPQFEVKDGIVEVTVGEVEHPMLEEHYIEWIAVQTKQGNQRKALKPGEAPKACFALCDGDEVVAVYEHCNLHGLWKK
jgi:superoxide reductase